MNSDILPTQKISLLIVDDTPTNLDLLSNILIRQGFQVRAAINGTLALMSAQATPPDLILLDIMMPDMDGYEVCRRLKAGEQTRNIPIIFISAQDKTTDKVNAFTMGGVDYITKPFQVEEVLARVRTHLALRALQKQLETTVHQLEKKNAQLEEALATIKTLSGLIPICAWCGRKIEDDKGQWVKVETYIEAHSEAEFTHGICPECLVNLRK